MIVFAHGLPVKSKPHTNLRVEKVRICECSVNYENMLMHTYACVIVCCTKYPAHRYECMHASYYSSCDI